MRPLKMKRKPLTTLICSLTLLANITSLYADNTSTNTKISCGDVIKACDLALSDKDAQVQTRDAEIGTQGMLLKSQADALAEKDRQLGAWYRSPWLYLGLGLAGGLYLGRH